METLNLRCRARRKWLWWLLVALALQLTAQADQIIYDDALENNWQNWGWATINYANTSPVHSGSDSISVTISDAWQGIQIWHSDMDSTPYTNITFWLNGGSSGGQKLQVYGLLDAGGSQNQAQSARYYLNNPTPVANTWQQYTVPLSALGVANAANFTGFVIQDSAGLAEPTFYLDDISLVTNVVVAGTNSPVSIAINASSNRIAISPLIYGVAFAASNELADLNFTMNRSGGNNETCYNWQINAHNLDADWYFESYPDATATPPGATADAFVANSKYGGAQPLITIPMIGWSPKLGANRSILYSYSIAKYGPQTGFDPYLTDAGNGMGTNSTAQTSWLITTNNPTDAYFPTNSVFQQGYVQHLISQWGLSTNGGVRYYIMDNEHSLWSSTHQDIHPVGPTMQEIWTNMLIYASMVKSNDPNALVCGPEEWGWPGYLYSGYDQQWAAQHGYPSVNTYPDRTANGGWDYMPWLLNHFQQYNTTNHQRLLDYFTVHCYPQEGSVSGDAVDSATELLRNASTRVFWDTNYTDPSWIDAKIALIPRMKNWIATNYPGTKIGITEYNWGAEPYINGATAQADILGIFGSQGLDLATRWTTPATNTPTYLAMKMYRNYDGNKSTFGDTSILATVPNPDNLSAFGAVRTSDGAMTLMVINKDLNNATPITANITSFNATGMVQRWQLTSANVITQLANITITNKVLSDVVPSQSITLYVLPVVNAFNLQAGARNSTNQLALWLNGQAGLTYILQSSTDLVHWAGVSTNTLSSNSFPYLVGTTNPAKLFYRSLFNTP
ncbi:MAG: glycoside hydrolase family 44 protein [Verrucomicrobiia bacterium]